MAIRFNSLKCPKCGTKFDFVVGKMSSQYGIPYAYCLNCRIYLKNFIQTESVIRYKEKQPLIDVNSSFFGGTNQNFNQNGLDQSNKRVAEPFYRDLLIGFGYITKEDWDKYISENPIKEEIPYKEEHSYFNLLYPSIIPERKIDQITLKCIDDFYEKPQNNRVKFLIYNTAFELVHTSFVGLNARTLANTLYKSMPEYLDLEDAKMFITFAVATAKMGSIADNYGEKAWLHDMYYKQLSPLDEIYDKEENQQE